MPDLGAGADAYMEKNPKFLDTTSNIGFYFALKESYPCPMPSTPPGTLRGENQAPRMPGASRVLLARAGSRWWCAIVSIRVPGAVT